MRPLTVFVLACSGRKLDHAAPVRDLYTGSMFRQALPVIEREAELATADGVDTCVRVLSAKHGLLALDEQVEPYDMRVDQLDQPALAVLDVLVYEQLTELVGTRDAVEAIAFLPRAYLCVLLRAYSLAGDQVTVTDVFEGCRGIGDQRHVIASLRANQNNPLACVGGGREPE